MLEKRLKVLAAINAKANIKWVAYTILRPNVIDQSL
jgi:hypothetical protein